MNWRNVWMIDAALFFYTKYYSGAIVCIGFIGLHLYLNRKK